MPSKSIQIDATRISEFKHPFSKHDLLVIAAYQQKATPDLSYLSNKALLKANSTFGNILPKIQATIKDESFTASFGNSLYIPVMPDWPTRILIIGLGQKRLIEGYRFEKALVKGLSLITTRLAKVVMFLPPSDSIHIQSQIIASVSATHQSRYTSREALEPSKRIESLLVVLSDFFKKDKNNPLNTKSKDKLSIASGKSAFKQKNLKKMVERAQIMALARSQAKDLVNMPPNLKSTQTLVDAATKMKAHGIRVSIKNDIKWIQKKMPAFYAVARGSLKQDPPKWIRLEYKPDGKVKQRICLVGKSVMYDTGGYQVKTGNGMVTMKADMTGGASVLAVMRALSRLKPEGISVRAYLAATPNMIDANAFVADSIIGSTCGKKIEIRHTDAEGRLTLIDAVAMAQRSRPDLILTIATLTGAATKAVGMRAALMSNRNDWRARMAKSARMACDPYQTLDVVAEDYEAVNSNLDGADLKNTGDSWGRGAQAAAAFVFQGAKEDQPIIHLDIAGGDMTRDDKATGVSVQACIQFLIDLSESK